MDPARSKKEQLLLFLADAKNAFDCYQLDIYEIGFGEDAVWYKIYKANSA